MKYFWDAMLSVPGLIILMALMFIASARAEDWSARFGPSIYMKQPDGNTKIFGVRREDDLMYAVHEAIEVGGFVDNYGNGRKSSALVKAQLGVKPGAEVGGFAKAFVGPCYLNTPDALLGGRFQFCTDVGLGMRDRRSFVDVGYGHISSAGIEMPNHGRDWLVFEAGVRY